MKTTPEPLRPRTRVLKIYDGHGAYVRHLGDVYFLAASELNEYLPSGAIFNDPEAKIQAATRLIAEIEIDPRAETWGGSSRFTDRDEYRRHRRNLSRVISICRRAWRMHQQVEALTNAR